VEENENKDNVIEEEMKGKEAEKQEKTSMN
jgi:hypothetical protein